MFSFFKEQSIEITCLKEWTKTDEVFYAPGVLVHVKSGKGVLREVYGNYDKKSFRALMLKDKPLVQFQGDEYYCPTCEKIIRAGYGIESKELIRETEVIQEKGIQAKTLQQEVEQIYPLLNLLQEGYYIVLDTELIPTNGNGKFFWEPLNEEQVLGSCIYYYGNSEWGNLRPYFTIASQPPEKCDKKQIAYYIKHPEKKAIAYYLDGYMSVLLDGHHKTFAAALRHEKVKALVIMPMMCMYRAVNEGERGISFGDISFKESELNISEGDWEKIKYIGEHLSDNESKKLQQKFMQSRKNWELPINIEGLVQHYPTAEDVAYIDRVGEIKEEMLYDILEYHKGCIGKEASDLMKALVALKHPLVYKMGEFFCKQSYESEVVYEIIGALTRLPKTEELEDFLIEQMIRLEDDYPDIKKIILEFL